MRGAREVLAEAIADEFGIDLDDKTMVRVDRILLRLFMFGFWVKPIKGLSAIMDAIR